MPKGPAVICIIWWRYMIMCAWCLQHEDKLAALDRRDADLKAQLHALANDAQQLKNKEGLRSHIPAHCSLPV